MNAYYAWITGTGLSLLLLTIEHLLWYESRLTLTWRYVMGVATLNIGITLALFLREMPLEAVGIWALTGASGALIAVAHKIREHRGELPGEIKDALKSNALVIEAQVQDREHARY